MMTLGVWRRAPITSLNDNGDKMYEGQVWKDGKPHGTGASYWETGEVLYQEQWQDGEEHGKGTLYDDEGTRSGNMANITALALNTAITTAPKCTYEDGESHGTGTSYDNKGRILW